MNKVLGKRTAVTKEDLEKLQYTEQVKYSTFVGRWSKYSMYANFSRT